MSDKVKSRFVSFGTGPDQVNGRDIPANFTPTQYTPDQVAAEGTDKISAHLKGLDNYVANIRPDNTLWVKKNPNIGEFSSIVAALATISDNAVNNPYKIMVGPGVFVEDTITMKSYVWVEGAEQDQTIIEVNDPGKHVVIGADNSGISKCRLHGATDAGFALVFYQSVLGTTHTSFFIEDVRFGEADTLVISDGSLASTAVFLENVKFGSIYQFNHGFLAQNGGRIINRNGTTTGMTAPYPDFVFKAVGAGSEIVINGLQCRSGGTTTGACIHLADGAKLRAFSTNIKGFGIGIFLENAGAASIVDAVGMLMEDNTVDLQIDHPDADGTYNGSADHTKIVINPASSFSVVISCNRLPTDGTGSVVVGSVLQGDRYDRLLDLSYLARNSVTLGRTTGGVISATGAQQVTVSAGYGFLYNSSGQYVDQVEWATTVLNLAPDSVNYIYVNDSGVVTTANSTPSLTETILLGRVVTDDVDIDFIDRSNMDMVHAGNKIEIFQREALGPIYSIGSIVTESGTRNLDVTGGSYHFGMTKFSPAGGTAIEFEELWQNGLGGWDHTDGQTIVNNAQYDDGSGTPANLTAGYYTKHSLYLVGDNAEEAYFLVLGQAEYSDLVTVEAAAIPNPPSWFTDAVVLIASIIVQEGVANLVQIRDERPIIGFKASGISASATHGNLLGLLADDHPQYLLVNGSRAMSGSLNMGGNSITNVNLVDGVDVSAHASRHLPNGSDPITTAIASGIGANSVAAIGTANSLSRSDHIHAVATGNVSTQIPAQANAAGVSNNLARADHTHNIPVGTPVTIAAANSEGVAATFARSDHVHDHGALAGGDRHAVATQSVAGFMSSSDKTKLDGISGARIIKSGRLANTAFTGTPRTATVTLGTAFPNTNYTIQISGTDVRSWSWESKLAGSFVINSNANQALTGEVHWFAISDGESVE